MPSRLLTRMTASKAMHKAVIFTVCRFISVPPRLSNLGRSPANNPAALRKQVGHVAELPDGQTAQTIRPPRPRVNRGQHHFESASHIPINFSGLGSSLYSRDDVRAKETQRYKSMALSDLRHCLSDIPACPSMVALNDLYTR